MVCPCQYPLNYPLSLQIIILNIICVYNRYDQNGGSQKEHLARLIHKLERRAQKLAVQDITRLQVLHELSSIKWQANVAHPMPLL